MEITLPLYSVLSKLFKIISPIKAVACIAIALFSFTYTNLQAQDATQIVVASGTNPSCSNAGVPLTATVTDLTTPANTPTGTVQFVVDGVNVGTPQTLVGGVATFTTAALPSPPATHTISANYISDNAPAFNNSTAANITQNVTAAPAATISYAGTPYCSNGGTAPVTRTGTTGGTYSSTTGLIISSTNGSVTLELVLLDRIL